MIRSMDPKELVNGMIAAIEKYGATSNQRELIHAAWHEIDTGKWEISQKAGN